MVSRESNNAGPAARPRPKPTILVLHASTGSGHRIAAEAIAQALRESVERGEKVVPEQPDDLRIEVLDSLRFARWYIDGNEYTSRFIGPTRPLYDLKWRYFFTGRITWNGNSGWLHVMSPRFAKWVKVNRPAAIVCTHITAANIALGARIATKQAFPIICVPTDYEAEGIWPHLSTDLFCAASEFMAETLRSRKVPESRIQITGIPVSSKFCERCDKIASREAFGLPQGKRVVLVLAGSTQPKPYERLRGTLSELLPMLTGLPDTHFAIVTGRDRAYAEGLARECGRLGLSNVSILGFVENMVELMSACDLAVCKAGGLIVTECLCAQIPMLLVGKAYGQEKINVRYLTSLGAAMHVQTARELYVALEKLSSPGVSLQPMLDMGELLRRPHAADDIAASTLRLAFSPPSPEELKERMRWRPLFYVADKLAHAR